MHLAVLNMYHFNVAFVNDSFHCACLCSVFVKIMVAHIVNIHDSKIITTAWDACDFTSGFSSGTWLLYTAMTHVRIYTMMSQTYVYSVHTSNISMTP